MCMYFDIHNATLSVQTVFFQRISRQQKATAWSLQACGHICSIYERCLLNMFYFYFQNEGKDSYDAIDIESSEDDDQYNKGQTEGMDAPQDDQPITKNLVIELLVCILAFVGRVSVSLGSQLYFSCRLGADSGCQL